MFVDEPPVKCWTLSRAHLQTVQELVWSIGRQNTTWRKDLAATNHQMVIKNGNFMRFNQEKLWFHGDFNQETWRFHEDLKE